MPKEFTLFLALLSTTLSLAAHAEPLSIDQISVEVIRVVHHLFCNFPESVLGFLNPAPARPLGAPSVVHVLVHYPPPAGQGSEHIEKFLMAEPTFDNTNTLNEAYACLLSSGLDGVLISIQS